MKVNHVTKSRTVVTSKCGMWTATVQKRDFRNWQVIFAYDGEWHHFTRRSHYAKAGAILIAKEFVENKSK